MKAALLPDLLVDKLPDRFVPLAKEFHTELIAIADWWAAYAPDREQGGFYGEIAIDNQPVAEASKGIILNARILWFFSEVAQVVDNPDYRACATRAYEYIAAHFVDREYGGVYWELSARGQIINSKKQLYAQAFTIYALSSYFQLTQDAHALQLAQSCFDLIEQHGIDLEREGYLEAFTREWGVIDDLRLSEKDLNFPKSQNTHLHILEAYTRMYKVDTREQVQAALRYNIDMFDKYMIDKNTYHLRMFMDLEWKDHSPGYTYGHDIEASWLIAQALESLGDHEYAQTFTPGLLNIVEVTLREALGDHGEVIDSFDFASQNINADSVWWVQAEALVGFLYAYSTTDEERYFQAAKNVWQFIKDYQIDHQQGEWFWLSRLSAKNTDEYYKAGFWKCPYHNGRAMLEAVRYLQKISC
jgi:cellobiose epimerase